MSPGNAERFTKGDHLTIPGVGIVYNHHGIYLGAGEVMEFAGGVHPTVRRVSLRQFESRRPATLVPHAQLKSWTVDVPPLPADEVVARARFLEEEVPAHWYNFFGFNCEHAASWCKTGLPESYQVKGIILAGAIAQVVAMGFTRRRDNRVLAAVPLAIPTFAAAFFYQLHSKRFWDNIGRKWKGYATRSHQDEM
jgi:hypothetical protein